MITFHVYKNHHKFIRDFSDPDFKSLKSKIRYCHKNKRSEKQTKLDYWHSQELERMRDIQRNV